MFVKFKFSDPTDFRRRLQHDIDNLLEEAKKQIADFLYQEMKDTSPVDTGTFQTAWVEPKKDGKTYSIVNTLPTQYIADGQYHKAGQDIIAPYNLYILEGEQAGAPMSYMVTSHPWIHKTSETRQLLNVNVMLWKFNQGMLGLNPYTILNTIFSQSVRGNF